MVQEDLAADPWDLVDQWEDPQAVEDQIWDLTDQWDQDLMDLWARDQCLTLLAVR